MNFCTSHMLAKVDEMLSAEWIKAKNLYQRVFIVELILALLLMLIGYGVNPLWCLSLLSGLMVGLIPHFTFMCYVLYRNQRAATSKKIVILFQGEAIKWGLTILGCWLVFKGFTVNVGVFFIGFGVILFLNSLLPLLLNNQK